MMKLSLREWVFLGLLLAIPVGMWHFVFQPQSKATNLMNREIRDKGDQLAALERTRDDAVRVLNREVKFLERIIRHMEDRIPPKAETDAILRNISTLAMNNRLKKMTVKTFTQIGDKPKGGKYGELNFTLECEGDFMGFYQFLQSLENQPRIMHVTHLKLERLSDKTMDGQIKVSMDMKLFFQKGGESS